MNDHCDTVDSGHPATPALCGAPAVAAPVGFVLLWSTGPVATKVGVSDLAAIDLLAWRFALLAAVMGGFVLISGRLRRMSKHDIGHCTVAGLLVQAIYLGTAFTALDMGMSAGFSALITGLQPIAAAIFAAVLLHERLVPAQIAGMALAFVGLMVYAGHQLTAAGLDPAPLALHLAGVVSIGAGLVYQRRYCSHVNLVNNLSIQYVAGGVFVTALALALPVGASEWTAHAIAALLWLVLVLSLGATTLLVFLANRGRVSSTASLFFLMPPTTAVMANLYLGERMTWSTVLGGTPTWVAVASFGTPPSMWSARMESSVS
jgi:drug/metabolite transporter (DMT)-like permease